MLYVVPAGQQTWWTVSWSERSGCVATDGRARYCGRPFCSLVCADRLILPTVNVGGLGRVVKQRKPIKKSMGPRFIVRRMQSIAGQFSDIALISAPSRCAYLKFPSSFGAGIFF